MKTITLEEAVQILSQCSAVVIDNIVTYPCCYPDESMFLELSWEDDHNSYGVTFHDADNQTITISGSSMFLIDSEGDENQITILCPQNLE